MSRMEATTRLGSPIPSQRPSRGGSPVHGGSPALGGSPIQPSFMPSANMFGGTPPRFDLVSTRFGTPPRFSSSPRYGSPARIPTPIAGATPIPGTSSQIGSIAPSVYGSFDPRATEIVKKHLVTEDDTIGSSSRWKGKGNGDEEFSSLQLQGGDITRPIYRYVEEAESSRGSRRRARSHSFNIHRPEPEDPDMDINRIKVPGGFRRNYLARSRKEAAAPPQQGWIADNFIEFLSIYGHFAGEELEEEDESEEWSSDEFGTIEEGRGRQGYVEEGGDGGPPPGEESQLLHPQRKRKRAKSISGQGTAGVGKAVLLLLKSFVGTGVLFLPKAYLNGGMLFSNLVLLFVAALSYYCFVLLVRTRLKVEGSFGDIGGILYGPKMRLAILFSIVISQIGFAAAYIVFTSENLQAFIRAVSADHKLIDIKYLILLQLVIFLPMSMVRDMAKLGGTALVADAFIMLGLGYLYYYNFYTIGHEGVADIVNFNPKSWTLFIGTAIFTFEGIGLIIPIQETMKHPQKFPAVLFGVMIAITTIFVSMGALSYAAYGTNTKTVIILNLPQDSKIVNGIQFLYSLAILLSTPLQLFPAIRIMENGLFPHSGKHNPYVKWQKNLFRFVTVFATAFLAWGGADDLDKFVALIGSFACIPLVYMYPPLVHMRACATTRLAKMADIGLCVFGLVVMVYTTFLTVESWAMKK